MDSVLPASNWLRWTSHVCRAARSRGRPSGARGGGRGPREVRRV